MTPVRIALWLRDLLLAGLLVGMSAPSLAQADLAVSTQYSGFDYFTAGGLIPNRPTSSGGSIRPGRSQTLRIVARNPGPGTVSGVYVELRAGPAITQRVVATPGPGCSLPPTPPLDAARWLIGAMAPGMQVECTLTLTPVPGGPTGIDVLVARIRADGNIDPDSANDLSGHEVGVSSVDYIRDMQLSIRSPQGILRPGTFHPVDFTLTNLGPGPDNEPGSTQNVYSELYRINGPESERFDLVYDGDPDCRYFVNDIGQVIIARVSDIIVGPLPAGASRTCTLLLFVRPGGSGIRRLSFWNLAEDPGVFDERLDNNIADMVLQYSAVPVPAGSPWAWVLLALTVGAAGALTLRPRPLRDCR